MTQDVQYDGETYQIRNGRVFHFNKQRMQYLPVASQSIARDIKRRAIDMQNSAPEPGQTNRSLFV